MNSVAQEMKLTSTGHVRAMGTFPGGSSYWMSLCQVGAKVESKVVRGHKTSVIEDPECTWTSIALP